MNTMNTQLPVSKQIMLVGLGTVTLLLVPLVAMLFTDQVAWELGDFLIAGALLLGMGGTYVLLARLVSTTRSRLVLGIALAAALFLVWAELAVGIIGTPFAGS